MSEPKPKQTTAEILSLLNFSHGRAYHKARAIQPATKTLPIRKHKNKAIKL